MQSSDKRIKIYKAISEYRDGYFTVDIINSDLISISSDNLDTKYVLFDSPGVYTTMDDFLLYMKNAQEIPKNSPLLRMPFFAGCSGYDLMDFLLEDGDTLDPQLDIKISFDILPSNFNSNGIKYFTDYLETVNSNRPIFKGNNNFTEYLIYFLDRVQEVDWKINLILPAQYSRIYPNSKAIQELFLNLNKFKQSQG